MPVHAALAPFGAEMRRWRAERRLSQLELANIAGTTQRHLSFLESGRSRPGRELVVRLSESLGLTLRERNSLLLTAGFAPVYPESPLDGPLLRPVREAVDAVLAGHEPYPAVVVGRRGELVAANRGLGLLTEGADAALLTAPINLPRLLLHPDGLAPRVANLGQWGRHVVEALRGRARRSPDPQLDLLIDELAGYLPPASSGRPATQPLGFAVPLRLLTGPVNSGHELRLITTLTSFATATDVTLAELHLEAFLPADAGTADYFRNFESTLQHG